MNSTEFFKYKTWRNLLQDGDDVDVVVDVEVDVDVVVDVVDVEVDVDDDVVVDVGCVDAVTVQLNPG